MKTEETIAKRMLVFIPFINSKLPLDYEEYFDDDVVDALHTEDEGWSSEMASMRRNVSRARKRAHKCEVLILKTQKTDLAVVRILDSDIVHVQPFCEIKSCMFATKNEALDYADKLLDRLLKEYTDQRVEELESRVRDLNEMMQAQMEELVDTRQELVEAMHELAEAQKQARKRPKPPKKIKKKK